MAEPHRLRGWTLALVTALALGAFAGTGAVRWEQHRREVALSENPPRALESDRLEETLTGLLDDGVVVSDDGRYLLDEAGEEGVAQAVAAAPDPVFVVVWAPDQELGAYESDVVERLADRLTDAIAPGRGVLYVWQGAQEGYVEELGGNGYSSDFSSPYDFVGDPAVTLPRAVAAAADIEWFDDRDSGSDYWGGWGGGTFLGVLLGTVIVLALRSAAFLVRLVGGPRLPGSWRPGARR